MMKLNLLLLVLTTVSVFKCAQMAEMSDELYDGDSQALSSEQMAAEQLKKDFTIEQNFQNGTDCNLSGEEVEERGREQYIDNLDLLKTIPGEQLKSVQMERQSKGVTFEDEVGPCYRKPNDFACPMKPQFHRERQACQIPQRQEQCNVPCCPTPQKPCDIPCYPTPQRQDPCNVPCYPIQEPCNIPCCPNPQRQEVCNLPFCPPTSQKPRYCEPKPRCPIPSRPECSEYASCSSSGSLRIGFCDAATLGLVSNIRLMGLKYPRRMAPPLERSRVYDYIWALVDNFPCDRERRLMRASLQCQPPQLTDRNAFNCWAQQFSQKILTDLLSLRNQTGKCSSSSVLLNSNVTPNNKILIM
jgi:hypothetical protein